MPKRVVTGIVTRDKAAKTRRVEVTRLVRHPRYGKILRRRTVCTAHDEENQSHAGDLVEIEESRPLSRTKRWKLLRVVDKGPSAQRRPTGERQARQKRKRRVLSTQCLASQDYGQGATH